MHTTPSQTIDSPPAPRLDVRVEEYKVLERPELTADDVLAVATGRILALVIRGYYALSDCEELAKRLRAAPDLWTHYAEGSGAEHIATLGNPLYGCVGSELSADCVDYFAQAPRLNRRLQASTAPWLYPADRVRLELDNSWPGGATLLRVGGRPAFFGLARFVSSGGGIEPHTDRADWDLPCPETSLFRAQLFLNVYLTQAEHGGDLELWDLDIRTRTEYDRMRLESSYALKRSLLPDPDTTIRIDPGTLVIANASKPHAVTPCAGVGERLSVSGFLGYSTPDHPLRVFS